MKKYIVEWKFEDFTGEIEIEAASAREAMKYMRTNYPTFTIDSFGLVC